MTNKIPALSDLRTKNKRRIGVDTGGMVERLGKTCELLYFYSWALEGDLGLSKS